MHRRLPAGLTLIEVLVVVAILAAIAALVVPAVQSARESMRQSSCLNNMRQWMVAMQHYESCNRRFPPGSISFGGGSTSASQDRRTFVVSLWPHLDAQAVLGQYDLQKPFWDPANKTAIEARVPIYYCPSDRAGQWLANRFSHAAGNYVCNWGNANYYQTESQYKKAPFSDYRFNYPTFAQIESRREPGNAAAAFLDGLSNTIFMSELVMLANDTDMDIRGAIMNNTAGGPTFMTKEGPNAGTDRCWCPGPRSATHPGPCIDTRQPDGWNSARSLHRGGVSVALGDGSTRFVSDSITLAIWQQYGTIRQSELVEQLP
jgi:prepilin-type N-terminal cleavage/methylation domain-containing protein